jgi:hypothetical protein
MLISLVSGNNTGDLYFDLVVYCSSWNVTPIYNIVIIIIIIIIIIIYCNWVCTRWQ